MLAIMFTTNRLAKGVLEKSSWPPIWRQTKRWLSKLWTRRSLVYVFLLTSAFLNLLTVFPLQQDIQRVRIEIESLKVLQHDNIAKLLQVIETDREICLILEVWFRCFAYTLIALCLLPKVLQRRRTFWLLDIQEATHWKWSSYYHEGSVQCVALHPQSWICSSRFKAREHSVWW